MLFTRTILPSLIFPTVVQTCIAISDIRKDCKTGTLAWSSVLVNVFLWADIFLPFCVPKVLYVILLVIAKINFLWTTWVSQFLSLKISVDNEHEGRRSILANDTYTKVPALDDTDGQPYTVLKMKNNPIIDNEN